MLRDVAGILAESTRAGDLVGRYAGDEFVIICRSGDEGDVARIAERIREGLQRHRMSGLNDECLNASIGFAYFPRDGADWRSLLSSADRRMYREKLNHHGRKVVNGPVDLAAGTGRVFPNGG